VVVYVEEDDDRRVFCSVKDDGPGFDPATTPPGVGISRSIRGRVEGIGGTVEIAASPGAGTEVRLWV
jgi:signal transduction histidine kinase